jgi:class 3 adenylate cyclase/tetratricopeptide (TPR) repeat protein
MKCSRCQHENRSRAKFCEECATSLARICSNCGTQLSTAAKFCPQCAHPVAGATPEARFLSPGSYTPQHLAEKILTAKSSLEGERKQVTVLFADLKGSMELLADRDPEEARGLLDPVLERMMEAVHRYEGTVNQVMGDGIMALFGAPLAREDHAVRACYAALQMQKLVKRYAEEARRSQGVNMQIRVGLNSGEVVVRAIGNDLNMDYSAVGQTTHLAARMEQLASPGSILLTPSTLELVEGFFAVNPLGPVPVKGLADLIEVHELTGAAPRRPRLHAAAGRGLTRFVGRQSELDQLRHALDRAASRQGQVVAIVGEPGVGKSRLVWEVAHSPLVHDWLVLHAGSVSYGKTTSYLPAIDLLKSYFAIEDGDSQRAVREKITGKLLTLDRGQEGNLPALLSMLDVPTDDPQWLVLDPRQRRRQTLDAVKRLLLRESLVQPMLVVLEDLHWVDSETQALLDSLVESLPNARLLLLVNYRPEYQPPWGNRTYCAQLRLDPLPPGTAEELLGALLGPAEGLQTLRSMLIARTEGNPFFLEESVRVLVEMKALVGERGAYRLSRPIQAVQVPATVQAVLTARIDRLTAEEKELLQEASVIGKDVPFAILRAIVDVHEDALQRRLSSLLAAELLQEATLFPDLMYTFKHALTHEVAYHTLLQDRRRILHAKIVDAIERLHPDRLTEHIDRLAHHALAAQSWTRALTYLRAAGSKALTHSEYRLAMSRFEQALEVLQRVPRSREIVEADVDIRLALRFALSPLGHFAKILESLREAESLASSINDKRRMGLISCSLANYHQVTGDLAAALDAARQAMTIAREQEDIRGEVSALSYASLIHQTMGSQRQAIEIARSVLSRLPPESLHDLLGMPLLPAVYARHSMTRAFAELGHFEDSVQTAREALAIAIAANHLYSIGFAWLGVGVAHFRRGDLATARQAMDNSMRLSEQWDSPTMNSLISGWSGLVLTAVDQHHQAFRTLRAAEHQVEAAGLGGRTLPHGVILWGLSEAHIAVNEPEEGVAAAKRSAEIFRQMKARGYEAWTLRALGRALRMRGGSRIDEAARTLEQALDIASELEMGPLIALCREDLGHPGLNR